MRTSDVPAFVAASTKIANGQHKALVSYHPIFVGTIVIMEKVLVRKWNVNEGKSAAVGTNIPTNVRTDTMTAHPRNPLPLAGQGITHTRRGG